MLFTDRDGKSVSFRKDAIASAYCVGTRVQISIGTGGKEIMLFVYLDFETPEDAAACVRLIETECFQ